MGGAGFGWVVDESLVAFGKLWTRSAMTLLLLHEHSRRGKRDTWNLNLVLGVHGKCSMFPQSRYGTQG